MKAQRKGASTPVWRAGVAMLALAGCAAAHAAEVRIVVRGDGGPLADAVVSLHSPQAAAAVRPQAQAIDQRDTQFQPHVSVVHVGSRVGFPNSDRVRHQVYSFSPAKRFELPLYADKPAAPVLFGKPGVVELGCNIHDWMLAYVVVVDTPYHAISDAGGKAVIQAPPGHYRMQVWHERLPIGAPPLQIEVDVPAAGLKREVVLTLAPAAPQRAPVDDRVRQLQERFRTLGRKGG